MSPSTNSSGIKLLPLSLKLMDDRLLPLLLNARSALAELKGRAKSIPNEKILLFALPIQEAKDSSEIENIFTTHDELFILQTGGKTKNPASKEAYSYIPAMLHGYETVKDQKIIRKELLCQIQEIIIRNNAGIRQQAGTLIKDGAGRTVYTPPQDPAEIHRLLDNLLEYINYTGHQLEDMDSLTGTLPPQFDGLDPLMRMAIIHHQFESIHPFYDGNGRTGRIINILSIIMFELLDSPILYLSRYITHNKKRYYELLRAVNEKQDAETWIAWIAYMVRAVERSAQDSLNTINRISDLMQEEKSILREQTKIYSQDLLNTLFRYPWSTRKILKQELNIANLTAIKYGRELEKIKMVEVRTHSRTHYYVHTKLLDIFTQAPNLAEKEGFWERVLKFK